MDSVPSAHAPMQQYKPMLLFPCSHAPSRGAYGVAGFCFRIEDGRRCMGLFHSFSLTLKKRIYGQRSLALAALTLTLTLTLTLVACSSNAGSSTPGGGGGHAATTTPTGAKGSASP